MRTQLLMCMLALATLCHAQEEFDASARQAIIERVLADLRSDVASGGFKVHSVAATQSDSITLLVQRRKDGGWARLRFVVDLTAPHPLLNLEVRPANAPAGGTDKRR